MTLPLLVGYDLAEARRRVQAAGWQTRCQLTQPPSRWGGGEREEQKARVVGQRVEGPGRVLLIYAFEDYDPGR